MRAAPMRKSMLGMQADSRLTSAPAYGFGTAERPGPASIDKAGAGSPGPVYYAKPTAGGIRSAPSHSFGVSHRYSLASQKNLGSPTPGPDQYTLEGAFSTQHDSQRFDGQTWKFGSSTRADQTKVFVSAEHAKTVSEFVDSPGPCAYIHVGSFGDQCDSRKKTTAAFGLGTNERFFHGKKNGISKPGVPGPGAYVLGPSHGRQVSSIKQSYPINSFPKADRDKSAAAQYLGPKHLQTWGRGSPGPAVYTLKDSVGTQISSAKPNAVHAGFGTADRFAYMNSVQQTPGPGSYSV